MIKHTPAPVGKLGFLALLSSAMGAWLAMLSVIQADASVSTHRDAQAIGTPIPVITLTSPYANSSSSGPQVGTPTPTLVAPFLFAPYGGSVAENAVFDHQEPVNDKVLNEDYVAVFNGRKAVCPTVTTAPTATAPPPQTPSATPIPSPTPGFARFGCTYSNPYRLADYNDHEGIDYDVNYAPVFAAADSNQVVDARWWNPTNHQEAYGLFITLHHPNGYRTRYGHLSSTAVQSCPTVGCTYLRRGAIIGISGNTGNSGGPHLHLSVLRTNISGVYKPIDPYGWKTSLDGTPQFTTDPWTHNQPESIWFSYPAVSDAYSPLPSGEALPVPTPPAGGTIIDDYAHLWNGVPPPPSIANFTTSDNQGTTANCWRKSGAADAPNAINNYLLRAQINVQGGLCWARWSLPAGSPVQPYDTYVHIAPSGVSLTESAIYQIYANGIKVAEIIINQSQIAQAVPDGYWVYIGKYTFSGSSNYVQVSNATNDPASGTFRYVIADAVQYVRYTAIQTVTLYDQISNMASLNINSQNYEPTYDAYDNQAADDFVVPAGSSSWAIHRVEVIGDYSGAGIAVNSMNVQFYSNAAGLPGTLISSQTVVPSIGLSGGNFVLDLNPPVTLASGTYWVSVQANLNGNPDPSWDEWFWTERTIQSSNPAVWRNPGGHWPCVTWAPFASCIQPGFGFPDLLFRLVGVVN